MSMTLERPTAASPVAGALLRRLALDITRTCQAACTHCYNGSSPQGEHGEMTREDWLRVIAQAAGAGVRQVQFIGGEPTLRPELPELINSAVSHGMQVEVFSNLIHVREALWPVLRQRGVTLATSYYSDHAEEHEAITKHRGSYAKTRKNIVQALGYNIPVRAAVVHVREGQRSAEAVAELRALGVVHVRTDRLRGIGRGAGNSGHDDVNELCGHCARGRAAVMPDGSVAGCVMSGGMMTAGNVLAAPLAEIVTSPQWAALAASIPQPARRPHGLRRFVLRLVGRQVVPEVHGGCVPDSCTPKEDSCQPSPGIGPVGGRSSVGRWLFTGGASKPAYGGCTPDEDSCQPSPGVDARPGSLRRLFTAPARNRRRAAYTLTACNPDNDSSDCAPAETEACGPSYD